MIAVIARRARAASGVLLLSAVCGSPLAQADAVETSGRVEAAIGRDLQFIRINGTLVGGLVGLVIHAFKIYL